MSSHTAPPSPADPFRNASRVELVFSGVEQGGPSFEGRVFLNNPQAHAATARTPDSGYAGSFHVFGHGPAAPPAIAEELARRAELGAGGAVAPIEKRVQADQAAVRTAVERSDEVVVTVVAVPVDPGGAVPERPFERVDVVFDRGG
jgi:hypothetical protein